MDFLLFAATSWEDVASQAIFALMCLGILYILFRD